MINKAQFFSILFRFAGAGSKFLLFLYLARVMQPSDVGLFALIISIVTITVQVIGLEIHNYNSRSTATLGILESSQVIDAQIKFHIVSHIVLMPLLLAGYALYLADLILAVIVCSLVFVEHISQEFIRFLQFRFMAEKGAFVIFLRSGAWAYFYILCVEFFGLTPTVINLAVFWLVFSIGALLVAALFLREYIEKFECGFLVSAGKIVKLLRYTWPFLISTGLYACSQNMDRFLLDYYCGKSAVGVFFFFSSIASVVPMAVTFGASVFMGPLIIKAYRNGEFMEYKRIRRDLIVRSFFLAAVAGIICVFSIDYFLSFIGRDDYSVGMEIIYGLLAAALAQVVVEIYGLELYIRGLDVENMLATTFAIVISLPLQIILISMYAIKGATVSAFIFPAILFLTKMHFFKRAIKEEPNLILGFK